MFSLRRCRSFFSVHRKTFLVAAVVVAGSILSRHAAHAATSTWVGPNNGTWNTAANWDTNAVPTAADDVLIATTTQLAALNTVQVPNGVTINFNNLTISTGTLYLTGNIGTGTNIILESGLFIQNNSTEQKINGDFLAISGLVRSERSGVTLNLRARNITFRSQANIGAAGLGLGTGAGAGAASGSAGGGGGGHYGTGGMGSGGAAGGISYCIPTGVTTTGSGGGAGSTGTRGFGGGLVMLRALDAITVSSGVAFNAAGEDGSGNSGGGGGGGIHLFARTVTGTTGGGGALNVAGGAGGTDGGGSGGGGCVLVRYATETSITTATLSAGTPGTGATAGTAGNFLATQVAAISAPTAPTSTSQIAASSILYSWTAGDGLENTFVLEKSTDGMAYTFVATTSYSTTTYRFTGLDPNSRYWFRVAASDDLTFPTSSYVTSSPVYTLANVPSAPTVTSVRTTSLDLTINVNSNPTTTLFALYNVTAGNYITTSGLSTSSIVFFATSSWGGTVDGLTPGTSYQFSAIARNVDGLSSATSSASTATTTRSGLTPNTPSAPTVTNATSSATTSSLNIVINTNNNSATTTYAIYDQIDGFYVAADGTTSTAPVFFTSSTWNNGFAVGLGINSPHQYIVVARSTDDVYATSTAATTRYTLTNPVLNFTATALSTRTIQLWWDSNGNPDAATKYRLSDSFGSLYDFNGFVSSSPGFPLIDFVSSSWNGFARSLTPSTTYTFALRSYNGNGSLGPSNSANSTTTFPAPVPNIPGIIVSSSVTSSSFQFSFDVFTTNSNSPTTTYSVYELLHNNYLATNGSTTTVAGYFVSSSWGGVTVRNLKPATRYVYLVTAVNDSSVFRTSTSNAEIRTLPAVVPAPTVQNISETTAQVLIAAGDNSLAEQTVYYRLYNYTNATYVDASGTPTSSPAYFTAAQWNNGTLNSLGSRTDYQFGIIPLNAALIPAATTTFSFSTLGTTNSSGGSSGGGGGGGIYGSGSFYNPFIPATSTGGTSPSIPGTPFYIFPASIPLSELPEPTPVVRSSAIRFFNIPSATTTLRRGTAFSFRYTVTNTSTISRGVRIERQLVNSSGRILFRTSATLTMRPGQVFSTLPRQVVLPSTLAPGNYFVRIVVTSPAGVRQIDSNNFGFLVR